MIEQAGMPSISIVMPFYNRVQQLRLTLHTLTYSQQVNNTEIIIVDDGSDEDQKPVAPPDLNCCILEIPRKEKTHQNPCIAFNVGIKAAQGDIIILQSPECLHMGDILDHASTHLSSNNYIAYPCYAVTKALTEKLHALRQPSLGEIRALIDPLDNRLCWSVDRTGWYNDAIYNPRALHFCAAIKRSNLIELNGFDERYANGRGYDDDEFLYRVRLLGLNVIIPLANQGFVVHQWHQVDDRTSQASREAYERNKRLFRMVTSKSNKWRVNRRVVA